MTDRENAIAAEELEREAWIYGLLGSVFLTLPDEDFWRSMKGMDWAHAQADGCADIACYIAERSGACDADVVLELGRDRAALVRGVGIRAIEPPYESLYIEGLQTNSSIAALNRAYSKAGFAVSGAVKDTSDQIGVEFSFMQLMCAQEAEALRQGDLERAHSFADRRERFAEEHLGLWKDAYAEAMEASASTGFYRGIAKMIQALPLL